MCPRAFGCSALMYFRIDSGSQLHFTCFVFVINFHLFVDEDIIAFLFDVSGLWGSKMLSSYLRPPPNANAIIHTGFLIYVSIMFLFGWYESNPCRCNPISSSARVSLFHPSEEKLYFHVEIQTCHCLRRNRNAKNIFVND